MTGDGGYANALALARAGRFADAERELAALVAVEPAHVDALQLMGVVVSSLGRVEESLEWFGRAKALRPASAAILQNRAQSLVKLGRLADARAEIEAALARDPAFVPAQQLLAQVLAAQGGDPGERRRQEALYSAALEHHRAGRLEEAIAGYREALAAGPAFAEAHVNIANALKMRDRHEEANAHYAEAYRIDPEFADALTNHGSVLREAGRLKEAIPLLERAAAKKPQSEYVHNNLGIAYFEAGRFAAAADCYRRALAIRPGFNLARNNLGNALAALDRKDEALQVFREVVAQSPGDAHAHSNLGIVLQEMGDVQGALGAYRRALELRPDFPAALNNMGFLLQEEGRTREAMELFKRSLAANPGYARAEYNLSLAHLHEFEFAEGWRLHESRYRTVPPVAHRRSLPFPQFSADDWGKGHRLAVWREQGVGDQLLYSSLMPDLEARGQDFVLEIDARLVPAMKRAHPGWNVVAPDQSDAPFSQCDRHAAMGDLAALLRPSRASFAAQPRALLAADRERAAGFRRRLEAPGARIVGISWRSFQPASRSYVQAKKSAPLAAFGALSRSPDLRLLDLQYGDTAAERDAFARGGGRLARLDDLDLFKDLDGLLAAIEACDLVVTTSNVTAHLAGSIGKRTLLVYLSANPPFHYWASDASGRCLWYPSLAIVTSRGLDTWEKAFARLDELVRA